MRTLGSRIKQRRAELHMSQAELAEAADVNLRQLGRYENDAHEPPLGVAARIAQALDVSTDELAGIEHTGTPSLQGTWSFMCEDMYADSPRIEHQLMTLDQVGRSLQLTPARAIDEHVPSFSRGELLLWQSDTLTGWFVTNPPKPWPGAEPTKPPLEPQSAQQPWRVGVLFVVLDAPADIGEGYWIGKGSSGEIHVQRFAVVRQPDLAKNFAPAVEEINRRWADSNSRWGSTTAGESDRSN